MEKIGLTDSELKIIKLMWQKSPRTLRQLEDALKDETGWTRHTIISFLKRMQIKQTVRVEDAKPVKLYYPLVTEEQVKRYETESLIDKLFGGSPLSLVNNLVQNKAVSDEELDDMLELLAQARSKK